VQIERLVVRHTGCGSMATGSFSLPRARYTIFVEYDPPEAVRSFKLVHQKDGPVPNWNGMGAERVGDVLAPIVQHELPAGSYEVEIGTLSPKCSWDVQVVLNSMVSWRRPPPPWRPSVAPPDVVTVRSGDNPVFLLSQTGRYEAQWTVGSGRAGHAIAPHSLDL
jgi:hypothetical protein